MPRLNEYIPSKIIKNVDHELGPRPFLFNFSASYSGGGYKRLINYVKWFDANGGGYFIINQKCALLALQFPCNHYFIINPGRWSRLWRDGSYLKPILAKLPKLSLYYSYGVPLFTTFARVNWFHLSNALPLASQSIPMSVYERLKFTLLGWRIRRGLVNADVISAESESSLDMIGREYGSRLFLSSNGFDEGLVELCRARNKIRKNVAVAVGTYRYKALDDAYRVFEMLRARNSRLRLKVFGPSNLAPSEMRKDKAVELVGTQPHSAVIDALRTASHYISTSRIENSSNADLEGIFLAENAWLSDIGAHREMLVGSPWSAESVPGIANRVLHVRAAELSTYGLKSWKQVIEEMITRFENVEKATF